ncbi:MAG: hypothetical protein FJ267_16105, partial [Planctomycetes bacterium]|nr:hypothetical protein [Planctomycetota bacterium]
MNPTPAKTYRNSGILAAIGTLVLLLGTATGNGITIFLMALVTLIVITIYSRHGVSKRVLFFMIVAAAIVAFVAVVLICVDLKVTE